MPIVEFLTSSRLTCHISSFLLVLYLTKQVPSMVTKRTATTEMTTAIIVLSTQRPLISKLPSSHSQSPLEVLVFRCPG